MKRVILGVLAGALVLGFAAQAQAVNSDDFSGTDLDSMWQVMNSDKATLTVADGKLKFEPKHNSNVWGNLDAAFVYQETNGDFDVSANFLMDYGEVGVVSGIIAYSPTTKDHANRDGQWVTLKLWGRANDAVIQYQRRENHNAALGYLGEAPGYKPPAGEIPIAMRMTRTGNEYRAWYKNEGEGDWIAVGGTVDSALANPVRIGVYAGIDAAAGGNLTVWYDDFIEASNPIASVDPNGKAAAVWGELKQ
ncbi:MAG: hypothetical protein OXT69_03935 [Candidatus Poribacteria bacterium]|nr:hypothetical protein [Candidatus Poribacteria bacterium]